MMYFEIMIDTTFYYLTFLQSTGTNAKDNIT